MATMADLDRLALAFPGAERTVSEDGRVSYAAHGHWFCFHREPRKDALDAESGERLVDVLVLRVPDLDRKEMLVGDARGVFFTTPHWNGYCGVLLRIARLAEVETSELHELLEDAWLSRAPRRVARAWIEAHPNDPDEDGAGTRAG